MYKEPHLNVKSKECSDIWYKWFELFQKKDPKAKDLRKDSIWNEE